MSIEYSAVLLVGLPTAEITYPTDEYGESIQDYDDIEGLENFSCYYHSGDDICGFVIKQSPDYWFSEIDLETLSDKIEKAKKDFFELTGQKGKLILTTYGR